MITTMERMDMSAETPVLESSQNSEIRKGWLEISERVLIQIALNRYSKTKAAEILDVSQRTLLCKRKKLGIEKRPEIPTNRDIYEILSVLPRTAIESFLLETSPKER